MRHTGAFIPRNVSAVPADDGRPEFLRTKPIAGRQDRRGKPGLRFPDSHATTETENGWTATRRPFRRRFRHASATTFRHRAANADSAPAGPKERRSRCLRQANLFPAATFTGENTAPPVFRRGGESSGNIRTFGDSQKRTMEQMTISMAKQGLTKKRM